MGVSEGPGLVIGSPTSYVGEGAIGAPDTPPAFKLSPSTHIPAGGVATTNRLTSPGGTFVAGVQSDDENPLDAINPGSGQFWEDELSLEADAGLVVGDQYEFQEFWDDDTAFDTYTKVGKWTIATPGPVVMSAALFRRPAFEQQY